MLLESLNQRAHAIVPQLDTAIVERGQHPGPLGMERDAFDSVAFRLKLRNYMRWHEM